MLNLLLTPNGRISSTDFMKSGYVLILLGLIPAVVQMINKPIGSLLAVLFMVLLYPWVCIWTKRLHQGGKSGWMMLLYVLLYAIILVIAVTIVMFNFGGEEFMSLLKDQMDGNISQAEYKLAMEALSVKLALPMVIASLLCSLLTLFIGDKTIGLEEDENKYGPRA